MVDLQSVTGPDGVLTKLGRGVRSNVTSAVLLWMLAGVGLPSGGVILWEAKGVLQTLKDTTVAISKLERTVDRSDSRAMAQEAHLGRLDSTDAKVTASLEDFQRSTNAVLNDHALRLITQEQAAIVVQERLKILEEPAETRALNHRQATKR